jgi:hypothetical protein
LSVPRLYHICHPSRRSLGPPVCGPPPNLESFVGLQPIIVAVDPGKLTTPAPHAVFPMSKSPKLVDTVSFFPIVWMAVWMATSRDAPL